MAKCVILWGEHPTEVVSQHHAREVARKLRKYYGHEVKIEKFPFIFTSYRIMRNPTMKLKEKLELLAGLPDSDLWTQVNSRVHGVPVFNFHCTEAEHMAQAKTKPPEKFKLTRKIASKTRGELQVEKVGENAFAVEMPAVYRLIPPSADQHMTRQLQQLMDAVKRDPALLEVARTAMERHGKQAYLSRVAALNAKGQKKYLHGSISDKIAAEINRRLNE